VTNADHTQKSIADLVAVMAALRTPGTGCPWDLEQSFETIAPYTLEEAYEVADAIARGDLIDLKDELGDLLLQVVYHARMAEELGAFDFTDVVDGIARKMVRRHPHVFGSAEERAAGPQIGSWDRIKNEENTDRAAAKAALDQADRQLTEDRGILAGVPVGLPALYRAVKLQDKAAKVGFDWPSLGPVFDKMREEVAELEDVALEADPRRPEMLEEQSPGRQENASIEPVSGPPSREKIAEELGDVLFVMANVARHLKIDPEAALRGANEKFRRRFAYIEERLAEEGRTPADSNLAEMDALWDEAKVQVPGKPIRP
jgi:nucleoside triphosphate diphosphatase